MEHADAEHGAARTGDNARQAQQRTVSDERFQLCSVELRQAITAAGFDTAERRLELLKLDWMDVHDMALNTFQRIELERFLGFERGALVRPRASDTPASAASGQESAESLAPCPGRGGLQVSNFKTERDKNWAPRGKKMGPETTQFLVTLGEYFEPRYRECLDDVRQLQATSGGKNLSSLLVKLLVYENIDEPGAEFILDGKQRMGILNCTINRVLAGQEKVRRPVAL